ncbi:MAG: redox-sensing transcriptional repressor Rex, partial [Phycisphaerae bacterium]
MRDSAHGNSGRSVPDPVLNRIPLYLRIAEDLRGRGVETISSRGLAQVLGLTDGQVRADLVFFGAFGRPGVGYRVEHLVTELRRIVGTDRVQPVALIGFGSIGRALVMYEGFGQRPFEIAAVFDRDPEKIGRPAGRRVV